MVYRRGIRAPKRRAHCLSCGACAREFTKGIRGHTSGQPQRKATRIERHAGGIIFNSGGGLRTGRHYSSLNDKEEIRKGRSLKMLYEKGGPTGDGVGGLRPRNKHTHLFQCEG